MIDGLGLNCVSAAGQDRHGAEGARAAAIPAGVKPIGGDALIAIHHEVLVGDGKRGADVIAGLADQFDRGRGRHKVVDRQSQSHDRRSWIAEESAIVQVKLLGEQIVCGLLGIADHIGRA